MAGNRTGKADVTEGELKVMVDAHLRETECTAYMDDVNKDCELKWWPICTRWWRICLKSLKFDCKQVCFDTSRNISLLPGVVSWHRYMDIICISYIKWYLRRL